MTRSIATAALCGVFGASSNAAILSIDGGLVHTSTPLEYLRTDQDNADVLQGFDEVQGHTLGFDLLVNGYTVDTGTVVDSHLIVFHPAEDAALSDVRVTFSGRVIAVIVVTDDLYSTNDVFAAPNTGAGAYDSGYGLEPDGTPGDSVVVVGDTVLFSGRAGNTGDRFRVLTAVPHQVPTSSVVTVLAVASLTMLRRARRQFV